jgi:hypothetical protein
MPNPQGWEQVKLRMEQLQAAKQKLQETPGSAAGGCKTTIKEWGYGDIMATYHLWLWNENVIAGLLHDIAWDVF